MGMDRPVSPDKALPSLKSEAPVVDEGGSRKPYRPSSGRSEVGCPVFPCDRTPEIQNFVGLEWIQVDLVRQVAWIHGEQSKSGTPIGVPLNETAVGVLEKQKGQNDVFVIPDRNGKARSRLDDRAWRKALRNAGIENFRWHDFRHTWAVVACSVRDADPRDTETRRMALLRHGPAICTS